MTTKMTQIDSMKAGRHVRACRHVIAAAWAGLAALGAVLGVPAHAAESTPQERAALEKWADHLKRLGAA